MGHGILLTGSLSKPKGAEEEQDDHDEADEVDDAVHGLDSTGRLWVERSTNVRDPGIVPLLIVWARP